jgi:hypothetical protein
VWRTVENGCRQVGLGLCDLLPTLMELVRGMEWWLQVLQFLDGFCVNYWLLGNETA